MGREVFVARRKLDHKAGRDVTVRRERVLPQRGKCLLPFQHILFDSMRHCDFDVFIRANRHVLQLGLKNGLCDSNTKRLKGNNTSDMEQTGKKLQLNYYHHEVTD